MPQLDISQETYEKIKDQLEVVETVELDSLDDMVGKKLFIRTVTYHCVGKVKTRMGGFIELEKASWIADSGRFSDAIKKGSLDEVEPVGTMWVNLASIVDFFPWVHKLPIDQK